MTDAEAEAMLAECRAVLPGLVWRMERGHAIGSAFGGAVDCAWAWAAKADRGGWWEAAANTFGQRSTRSGRTVREALAWAREDAIESVRRNQAAVDRERAWLGVPDGR